MRRAEILIVGAGPAGTAAAITLARAGADVLIFDHSHPREKFCAGGIPIESWECMRDFGVEDCPRWPADIAHIKSPRGDLIEVISPVPAGFVVSRLEFDGFLLARAREAGATHIPERVVEITEERSGFSVRTPEGVYEGGMLIGADGVRSLARKTLVGPIPMEHRGLCVGASVPTEDPGSRVLIDFFSADGYVGYFWIFPARGQFNIGIGSYYLKPARMREIFLREARAHGFDTGQIRMRAAQLPIAKRASFFDLPLSGDRWALVGDAAGHVISITGEGIGNAVRDGLIAARTAMSGSLRGYGAAWEERCGSCLKTSARMLPFFKGPLLNAGIWALAGTEVGSRMGWMLLNGLAHELVTIRTAALLPRLVQQRIAAARDIRKKGSRP